MRLHVLSFSVHLSESTRRAPNRCNTIGNTAAIDFSEVSKVSSEASNCASSKTPNSETITAFTAANFGCNLTCNNTRAAP